MWAGAREDFAKILCSLLSHTGVCEQCQVPRGVRSSRPARDGYRLVPSCRSVYLAVYRPDRHSIESSRPVLPLGGGRGYLY